MKLAKNFAYNKLSGLNVTKIGGALVVSQHFGTYLDEDNQVLSDSYKAKATESPDFSYWFPLNSGLMQLIKIIDWNDCTIDLLDSFEVKISSGCRSATLIPYPGKNVIDGELVLSTKIYLDDKVLLDATSTDPAKPVLESVQIKVANSSMTLTTVDGHKLMSVRCPVDGETPREYYTVHKNLVKAVCGTSKKTTKLQIDFYANRSIRLTNLVTQATVLCKCNTDFGSFPNWELLVPSSYNHTVDVNTNSILDTFKLIKGKPEHADLLCFKTDGSHKLTTSLDEALEANSMSDHAFEVSVKVMGSTFKLIGNREMKLSWVDKSSQIVFQHKNLTFLLMPTVSRPSVSFGKAKG
jgi:hypothetical protein